MISVLSKPLDQIGPGDVQELIDSEVPEGEQIEFKEALSTRGGSHDRWLTHGDRIGERARNELLEEVVAFANAYGGALVLGIAESEANPPIAAGTSPIPRCAELAERLKLVFRDCVEPQIPRVEIVAVPTEEDGDGGVVVIRTGRSRMAPHRVKPTRKCPIRRADRCEEMTMREIQDLTMNLARGLERLERRLARRSERFADEFECLDTPDDAVGIRVTALPVGEDIQFDRVYGEDKLYEPWHKVSLYIDDSPVRFEFPWWETSWRPMLRSARAECFGRPSGAQLEMYREIHCDGLVEIGLVDCRVQSEGTKYGSKIFCEWMMIVFANLLVWADRVRNEAAAPTVNFAVEVEISVRGENASIVGYGRNDFFQPYGTPDLGTGSVKYPGEALGEPRYSLGEADGIPDLIALFERDFWNSIGHDVGGKERRFVIEEWSGDE